MYRLGARNAMKTPWPTLLLVLFICISGADSALLCNQTYVPLKFDESSPPIADVTFLDVDNFCKDGVQPYNLSGDDIPFKITGSKLICTNPDAEYLLTTNPPVFANPWTMTVKVSEADGNFTFLTVFVRLASINDNKANITNLTLDDLREDTPVGTKVGGCTLTDGDFPWSDHAIPYVEITAGNDDKVFAVNPTTCDIILIRPLSYAKQKSYTLTFRAFNFPNRSDATTLTKTVNVLPVSVYPPRCSPSYIVAPIMENAALNTVIATLNCSTYQGNTDLDYFRESTSSIPYLDVDQVTGKVFLNTTVEYNNTGANTQKQITVRVVPRLTQGPATNVTVLVPVLDVDNNPPQFTTKEFRSTISSNVAIGTSVVQLSATDKDAPNTYNSKITYGLDGDCTPPSLVLDTKTGILYLNETLDKSQIKAITCKVFAYSSDNVTIKSPPATVNITVTADSNLPPVFSQNVFQGNVTENSNTSTFVLNVFATDPENGSLTYSFPAGKMGSYWPFNINPVSGAVSVASLVNYEDQQSYFGPVTVTDQGAPPLVSTAYVTVTVIPVNEFTPTFSSSRSASINKLDDPGTLVMKLEASDGDHGDDGKVQYFLEDSNAPFVLDRLTGNLTIGSGLDQVTGTFYNLTVKAVDQSKTKVLSSTIAVIVNFNKDNNNYNDPVCDPLGPLSVTPNTQIGNPIGYLRCTDVESGSQLKYDIIKSVNNLFEVVTYNGTIRLATTPIAGSYTIVVSVSDQGNPPRTAVISVQINVVTTLAFTNLPATKDVYENSNSTDLVYTVKAKGSFDLITYAITGGNTEGKFNLHQTTGDLRIVTNVDRETTDSYTLQITASATDGQSVNQKIIISVLDRNDNVPRYNSSFDYLKISEGTAAPSRLKKYTASDLDIGQNAEIVYSIISGNTGSMFTYTSTGELQLKGKLDRKVQSFYALTLCATDKGVPPLNSTILVNVEILKANVDNLTIVPSGGTVPLSLPEDVTIGAPIVKIQVANNNTWSDLTFAITSGNSGNNFTIDERTGEVYPIYALDRETADVMTVGVQVSSSSGQTDTTILVINITDVNDNNPRFNPDNYVFSVPHGTPAGSVIGTLFVTDPDIGVNKNISLSITSGNTNNAFQLRGTTIMARSVLDANVENQYQLQVIALDHGSPVRNSTAYVTVLIGPEFKTPYFVPRTNSTYVEETRTPGSLIYNVDATFYGATEQSSTNPGDLIYSLSSGDSSKFYVEKDIGHVQLASDLSFSDSHSYTLTITAVNKYNYSLIDTFTLNIIVTQVNRYSPVFSKDMYLYDVSETAAAGTAVGRLSATDKDPGQFGNVSYSIESNTNFIVNSLTGVVTLVGQLEYSIAKSYNLIVEAIDNAGSNSKTATSVICIRVIDMNNHYPRFINTPYTVTVPESLPVGSVLEILVAEDLDSGVFGTVSYSILSGDSGGKFAVGSTNGALTLTSSLDFETTAQYIFIVRVQDGGSPPLSNTTILTVNVKDTNDHAPRFVQSRIDITIDSDTSPLTSIGQVSASDADSGKNAIVNYIIESGNDDHLFSIDTVSGVITTATSLTVAPSFHSLTIAAIDHGLPPLTGTVTVAVVIRPAQQSPGSANFVFSVKENEAAGTLVGIIPRDPTLINTTSYTISGGNIDNAFMISKSANNSGILQTTIPLDRETYAYYRLVVSISSNTNSKIMYVLVKVTDENDNAPIFVTDVLRFQVVENLAAGYTLGTLTATDPDENGVNNQVDMAIAPARPPVSTYFTLEPTGTIKLKSPISYEDISSFVFFVIATDRGTPQRSSTATIYVNVVDVDETIDYNYVQTASFIARDIPDDAVEGDIACSITPADFGLTPAQSDTITYTTVGENSVFSVHPSAGYLLVKRDSFITPATRYFQWVIATVTSGGNTTSYALMVRLDTFNKKEHLFSVKANTNLLDLRSKLASLQNNLQAPFTNPQNVFIWQTRSTDPDVGRRRLLAAGSEALAVVEVDKTVNDMSNATRAKTFLTSAQAMKALQQSGDGTPVSSVASGSPPVDSVQPYYTDDDDSLDPAYIALIVIGSLFALALIAAIIALIVYCACYRRKKGSEKKRLTEKKQKSKRVFGNLNKPKSRNVQSGPDVITNNLHDPDADGMPVKPTKAHFISSSNVDSDPWPKHNSTTMLESLEERMEEEYTDGTSHA